jgi:exonuclease III
MTEQSAVDGRSYIDTVRSMHYGRDMPDQWSWQNSQQETLCTGETGFRRSRIDYIFASSQMTTLDAGTDQEYGYSDHRFVWARLSLPDQ